MWEWLTQYFLPYFGPEFWIPTLALAIAGPLLWRDYLTRPRADSKRESELDPNAEEIRRQL